MEEIVSVGGKCLEDKLEVDKRMEAKGKLFFKTCQEKSPLIDDN